MNDILYNAIDEFIEEFTQRADFTRLIELKKEIDIKLKQEVLEFKKAKDKYEEALKFGSYYPGLDKIRGELSKSKENLYSNELVKEYIKLERQIQKELDCFTNEIAKTISNKIDLKKIIE